MVKSGELVMEIEGKPTLTLKAGDSFVTGLIHGLLVENDAQKAVDYGAAHGALAMTTPGDTSMATFPEVQKLAEGGDAKVQR